MSCQDVKCVKELEGVTDFVRRSRIVCMPRDDSRVFLSDGEALSGTALR